MGGTQCLPLCLSPVPHSKAALAADDTYGFQDLGHLVLRHVNPYTSAAIFQLHAIAILQLHAKWVKLAKRARVSAPVPSLLDGLLLLYEPLLLEWPLLLEGITPLAIPDCGFQRALRHVTGKPEV
mmetsp:Transcript_28480/g.75306  ORF Transcript_28480/g.75306 Transcript_28480/m.75306 type:complete len:125 (+) Transcript_28480:148-522(+)|eukprot:7387452-Prymnesium_polylepis.1